MSGEPAPSNPISRPHQFFKARFLGFCGDGPFLVLEAVFISPFPCCVTGINLFIYYSLCCYSLTPPNRARCREGLMIPTPSYLFAAIRSLKPAVWLSLRSLDLHLPPHRFPYSVLDVLTGSQRMPTLLAFASLFNSFFCIHNLMTLLSCSTRILLKAQSMWRTKL